VRRIAIAPSTFSSPDMTSRTFHANVDTDRKDGIVHSAPEANRATRFSLHLLSPLVVSKSSSPPFSQHGHETRPTRHSTGLRRTQLTTLVIITGVSERPPPNDSTKQTYQGTLHKLSHSHSGVGKLVAALRRASLWLPLVLVGRVRGASRA
jgi:hypothetical protein